MNTESQGPIRVQRSRKKRWRMPENTVYVGRGSRWSNPFRVVLESNNRFFVASDGSDHCKEILSKFCNPGFETKDEAAKLSIKCYTYYLTPYTHDKGSMMDFYESEMRIEDAVEALKGKNLACWCKLDETCHADWLLKMVNS